MSVNLLDLIQACLGKDLINQLSGVLGESHERTQAAVASSIPALLGGLVNKASSQAGADELMRALDNQDIGLLDNLPKLISGQNLDAILAQGSGLLKLIFGGSVNSVLDLLPRSLGLGGKSTSSLMAILAPIVMSLLKQQRSAMGLDVGGLVQLLLGQKEFLRGKLPGGLGDLVGLAGLADAALGSQGRDRGSVQAPNVAAAKTRAVTQAGDTWLSRLLPLIALLALALITWQLFSKRPDAMPVIDTITKPMDSESMLAPSGGGEQLQGPPRDESFESPSGR